MDLTEGTGIGRICECSGVSQMVNTCFSYLRKGGRTVLMVGLPKQPLHVENVLQDIGKYCVILFYFIVKWKKKLFWDSEM